MTSSSHWNLILLCSDFFSSFGHGSFGASQDHLQTSNEIGTECAQGKVPEYWKRQNNAQWAWRRRTPDTDDLSNLNTTDWRAQWNQNEGWREEDVDVSKSEPTLSS